MKQNGGNIFAGMRCLCFCHVFLGTVVRGRISMAPKRFYNLASLTFTLCEVTVQSRSNVFVLFVVLLKVHARALNSVVLAVQPLIMQNVSLPTI